jgi:uncharacterized protein YbcI
VKTGTEDGGAGLRAPGERGLALAAISNAVVRIHKRFYGRGPIGAHSHLSGNVLTVLLESGLTRSERTLCAHGQAEIVLRMRLVLQSSIEPELRAAIESELRRPVRSLMCALDPQNELEAVVCVLASHGDEMLVRSSS